MFSFLMQIDLTSSAALHSFKTFFISLMGVRSFWEFVCFFFLKCFLFQKKKKLVTEVKLVGKIMDFSLQPNFNLGIFIKLSTSVNTNRKYNNIAYLTNSG